MPKLYLSHATTSSASYTWTWYPSQGVARRKAEDLSVQRFPGTAELILALVKIFTASAGESPGVAADKARWLGNKLYNLVATGTLVNVLEIDLPDASYLEIGYQHKENTYWYLKHLPNRPDKEGEQGDAKNT